MRMSSNAPANFIFLIIISIAFLTGCTPEKAEALLSAAKAFQNEAKKAITAHEELLLAGLDTPKLSEKEAIADIARRARFFTDKNAEVTYKGVTVGLQDPFGNAKGEIKALVQRQHALYDAFADSLTNLPRGSYFAAEQVQCVEEIARRLIINIAKYRETVDKRPVSLVVPEEDAVDALKGALKISSEAAKTNDSPKKVAAEVASNEAARKIYELYNRKIELNAKVVAQATIAAEVGLQVVKAAQDFEKLSVEDMIGLARQGLTIAGSIEGLDAAKAIGRLDKALVDAKGGSHWQKILELEIYQPGTKCNPIKSDAGSNPTN